MKKTMLSFLLGISILTVCGQDLSINNLPGNDIREKSDYFYARLSRDRMQTNVLADKGITLIDPRAFDGSSDSLVLSNFELSFLYQTLYYGRNGKTTFSMPSSEELATLYHDWQNMADTLATDQVVPLTLLYADYDKLYEGENLPDSTLPNTEWFTLENGQLVDVANPISPYLTYTLVAAAANSTTIKPNATFVLPQEAFISNKIDGNAIQLSIDFDDGNGYVALLPDVPLEVNYTTEGTMLPKLKVEHDGNTYYTKFIVKVEGNIDFSKDNIRDLYWENPDGPFEITYEGDRDDPLVGTAVHVGPKAYIYLRDGHNGKLHRPVLLVEGFDVGNKYGEGSLYNLMNDGYTFSNGLARRLNLAGYDLILLDFDKSSGHDIRSNAEVLRTLIKHINTEKEGNEKLVIAGASMGGVITRYTLAKMEQEYCEDHETRLYISYDAPHQGANVPVAMQYILYDLGKLIGKFSEEISDKVKSLQSPAAKQLLLQNAETQTGPHAEHVAFYNELNAIGYPTQCRKVGITMGNTNNNNSLLKNSDDTYTSLPNYTGGDRIFEWQQNKEVNRIRALIDVYGKAIQPGSNNNIAKFRIGVRQTFVFGFGRLSVRPTIDIDVMDEIHHFYGPGGTNDYDPGGYTNTQEAFVTAINDAVIKGPFVQSILYGFNAYLESASNPGDRVQHTIVSTNSGLDIDPSVANTPYVNYSLQQLVNLKLTPFDALYQKSTNYNHSHTGNVTNIEQGFGGTSFVDDLYDEITQNRVANTFLATTLDHEYNLTTAVQQHLPSITVANQGVLKINANQGAGLGNGPTPVAGSLYEISTGQCNPVDVEVLSGGIIEVGETSPNNKVHVIFQEGSSLTIENGGQLVIHENSVVTIETGASYTVNDLRNVVIKPGGVLKVEGMFYFDDSNPFNITGGGTLHLKPENVTVLDLNQLNNFAIDNSTLILDENTELSYHIGNKLTLNSGILEIRNQLTIAPNATFTFGSDAGQALGMLRLSPYDSENFMVAGSGSEFVLPISTSGNPVLDIQANTRLYSNYQTGAYFDRAVFDDSHINIAPGKYLQTGAPVLRMNHTTVTGGGTLAVFRPIASATDGGNFHQITNCVIDGSVLSNAPSFLQQKEAVTVTRSQFINKALLFDSNSKGIHVTSCAFTENSSFLCYRGLNSEIVNCTFDGELIDNTSAIRLSSSFSPVKIKDNTIEHYKKGVNATSRSQYGMACNIVVDNEIGLNHGSFSEALMAGANQGYNYITNNTLSNLMVNYGQIIDFNGGGNAFFNDQTTGGNRYIFGGICYTQAKVYCGTTQYYDCTNNQWSEENPLAQPSSLGGKFNLRILDPITCDVCPFIVRDLLPKELIACPYRGVIGSDKPNIPGLTGLSNIDHIVGDAHVDFCTSCPPIQTEHFKGTPLTQAINEAALLGSFNDGEDDVKSLELYRQILTYNYPDRNEEVYAWLKKAYIYAKAAASALLANNIQAEVEPRIQDIHRVYDPALFEGNTDIDKLFYQADKADFERYFGRIENAWSQLAALAAQTTGKIQALMNQRLATVSAEIQYLAGEIPWDDFMDTIQNLVGTGGGTIGVGPDGSGCDFVINKTADPNRQQTFANAGQTTTALMPAGATTWKMSNAALEQVFAINPNPAKEKVLVTVAINNRAKQLRLVDISGKQMMAPLMLENELTEFSVSEIPVGIYFVQLFENEVLVKTEKLLIIK